MLSQKDFVAILILRDALQDCFVASFGLVAAAWSEKPLEHSVMLS